MNTKKTPFTNGNCLVKLSGMRDSLKHAERNLADFILGNPEQVMKLTMEELAEAAESSYATVYRFAKRLGFSGYKDFKASLVQSMVTDGIEGQLNTLKVDKTTSTEQICVDIYDFYCRTIKDCVSIIDPRVIDEVVKLITGANFIYFIGAGASYISAFYAYTKFFRLGLNCGYEPSPTFFTMRTALMTDKDVMFAISSSGRTKAVVDAVKIAKKRKAKIIGLSDFAISPLMKLSDINLHTTQRNVGSFMNFDLPLVVGQITILDILHLSCCARMGVKASNTYALTKAEVDKEKS